MNEESQKLLAEIRDMLKVIADGQEKLMKSVNELREEHRKLQEEIRISNFVLNNIALRGEILN